MRRAEVSSVADYDPEAWRRACEQMAAASEVLARDLAAVSGIDLATAAQRLRDALADLPYVSNPDETGGMTLDELLPEIDSFLAEYRSEP